MAGAVPLYLQQTGRLSGLGPGHQLPFRYVPGDGLDRTRMCPNRWEYGAQVIQVRTMFPRICRKRT